MQAGRSRRSVPAEAARQLNRLKFGEVQLADRTQCVCGRTVLKAVRQAVEPGGIFRLRFDEAGDVIVPASGAAAMIARAARAGDRCSRRSRGGSGKRAVYRGGARASSSSKE